MMNHFSNTFNFHFCFFITTPHDTFFFLFFSWELLARGKKFEEIFSYETFAFIDYTTALRVARFGEIHWRRGLLLRRKGNRQSALEDVGAAIDFLQIRVSETEAMSRSGSAMSATSAPGNQEDSTSAANKLPVSPIVSILNRKLEMYIVVRGAIQYSLSQYQLAIDDFTRVLKTDPDNPEAFQQRSLALTQLSQFEEVCVTYFIFIDWLEEEFHLSTFFHLNFAVFDFELLFRLLKIWIAIVRVGPRTSVRCCDWPICTRTRDTTAKP